MIDKINKKIGDLKISIDELHHSANVADKLGFTSELSFISHILKERIDFRNYLLDLIEKSKETK